MRSNEELLIVYESLSKHVNNLEKKINSIEIELMNLKNPLLIRANNVEIKNIDITNLPLTKNLTDLLYSFINVQFDINDLFTKLQTPDYVNARSIFYYILSRVFKKSDSSIQQIVRKNYGYKLNVDIRSTIQHNITTFENVLELNHEKELINIYKNTLSFIKNCK